jgi:hypothetical protein
MQEISNPTSCKLRRSFIVIFFEVFSLTALVLGTEVDRQQSGFAGVVDQSLRGIEIALSEVVFLSSEFAEGLRRID